MARRKKASRRRSPRAVSLLNVAESYAYANVLTSGLMGTTPVGFVTGATDLGMKMVPDRVGGYDTSSMVMSGGDSISLGDIVSAPDAAFGIVQSNFMNNYQAMAVQSIGIGLSFRLGKRLLRRPISNVNRNIFKPLGAGFKL
jgi:hypothetical protein